MNQNYVNFNQNPPKTSAKKAFGIICETVWQRILPPEKGGKE